MTTTTSGRRTTAIVLAVLCVASAATLVWLLQRQSAASAGGLAEPGERERVMSVTDQFVKRLGTYGPDLVDDFGQMPDYREQVRQVITPKFAADFDDQVTTAEQLVAQAGVTRSTDVFATAVSSMDDDSARVLVAGAFNDSYEQAVTEKGRKGKDGKTDRVTQEPYPFRFSVDLVEIDGEWLVDDFTGVGAASTQPGQTEGGEQ